MNGEATAPLPAVAAATETERLIAVSEQVLAELAENRRLLRMALAAHPGDIALISSELRLAELEYQYRQGTEQNRQSAAMRAAFELITGLAPPPLAAVPDPPRRGHRKSRTRQRAPGEHPVMFPVPGIAAAAFAALKALAPHKAAVAALVAAGAVTGAGVSAVTLTHAHAAAAAPGSSATAPAPAASAYAVPAPDPSLVSRIGHPGTLSRHARKEQRLPPVPAAWVAPDSPSSASPSQVSQPSQSSQQQGPAGPPQLSVSTTAIDLSASSTASATITLSVTGPDGSWVSWRVDTKNPETGAEQADLDFTTPDGGDTHGILKAGQSVTITVTVDQAQVADGNTSEVFTINGQPVTAALPASSAAPAPAVTVTPGDAPSEAPSPASS